jgi:hypothetical protein
LVFMRPERGFVLAVAWKQILTDFAVVRELMVK